MEKHLQKMRRLASSTLLLLLLVGTMAFAGEANDIEKVIEKEFKISADGTVNLKNKFGSIIVTESTSNTVKIKVTINSQTSSKSKADKVFERIAINFSDSPNYVSAETEIEEKTSWNGWLSWGSDYDFNIKYEVSMPISAHLKVENKYGDINLPDLNNGLDIVNKYGKIMMRSVEGETSLSLGYGEIDFGDLGSLTADIKYSKIRGSSTQDFRIDSKYSRIRVGDIAKLRSSTKYDTYEIDNIGELDNEGKYDKWYLGRVGILRIDSKYAPIKVDRLEGDFKLNQKYGSVYIEAIECNSSKIDIDVEYTDVELGLGGCGSEMDYKGEYVSVRVPSDMEGDLNEDDRETWLKGRFGNGERKIDLNMRHAKLKIW